jgi:hypothetical protein
MTDPSTVQAVAAVAGVVVASIGFVAIIVQLRQVERGLRSSARGSIYDMAARIKELFIEHPNLRPYFLDGKPISPSDESYSLALAVADYYCLYLEQIATQGENIAPSGRQSWYQYAADVYARSPVLRDYLRDKAAWYAPEFWAIVLRDGLQPSNTTG